MSKDKSYTLDEIDLMREYLNLKDRNNHNLPRNDEILEYNQILEKRLRTLMFGNVEIDEIKDKIKKLNEEYENRPEVKKTKRLMDDIRKNFDD